MSMLFEWDETKRQANRRKHGVDFMAARRMLEGFPLLVEDVRREYGERRCQAYGDLDGVMLAVVFTLRGDAFRIISARKANLRERRRYGA